VLLDRLERAAEVAELGAALVNLDSLAVVLDLGQHSVRALLDSHLHGLAGLGLGKQRQQKTKI